MAKLKHIVRQLSDNDYTAIYQSLMESNADKSAYLLKAMREKPLSDTKIMQELEVNTNAYYTLRSRLNQKIEEYLLQQMESPRTDLLKKVANINEVIFTKKKAISIATLKKLEKELLDYDLSNELTVIYKTLKKLHINSTDAFHYSQLYNKHVAYMLAVDKAEDLLAEYFRKFGSYAVSGDDTEQLGLILFSNELDNVCSLYKSHRLYVYQSCISIFHRLYITEGETTNDNKEPIEDILNKVEEIFNTYSLDSSYFHLKLVFEFLRLEYYSHYKVYKKAETYFDEINEDAPQLLANYSLYTFPSIFLATKLHRCLRLSCEHELHAENERMFTEFETDPDDAPQQICYATYRAISCYYDDKFEEAGRWLNNLINSVHLKRFLVAQVEVKTLLALQYCCLQDHELFNQLVNSIQRQIRIIGKEKCEETVMFLKILKTAVSEAKKEKRVKVKSLVERFNAIKPKRIFCMAKFIKTDERFVNLVVGDEGGDD